MWQNYAYMDGSWGHGGYLLGMGLHGVLWLLLAATIAFAVVWTMRAAAHHPAAARGDAGPDPREILDGRYARGEIEREDYLARKGDLEAGG